MGTFANPQIISIENQDRRRTRSLSFNTAGAINEPGSPVFGEQTSHGAIWFKMVVPDGVSGLFAVGPVVTATQTAALNIQGFNSVQIASGLYRQEGVGFDGLVEVGEGQMNLTNNAPVLEGVRVNCQGSLQGRSDTWYEWAVRGGETYYLYIATGMYNPWPTHVGVPLSARVQWSFAADTDPEFTSEPTIAECPGEQLSTYGSTIHYYLINSGWKAWMKPGAAVVPNAPALPTQGHMFAVVEWIEQWTVHTRTILVGWTEESGPFFYGHLHPDHDMRTWFLDDTGLTYDGAGSPDGQNHAGMYVEHSDQTYTEEMRSNVGGLLTEPVVGWGASVSSTHLSWSLMYTSLVSLNLEPWMSDERISTRSGTARVTAILTTPGTTETVVRVHRNGSSLVDVTISAGQRVGINTASIAAGDALKVEVLTGGEGAVGLRVLLGVQ